MPTAYSLGMDLDGALADDMDWQGAAQVQDLPYRIEHDSFGEIALPRDRLWGAQTERSRLNFPIGVGRFRWGRPVIRGLGILKKCAVLANGDLGQLPESKVDPIVRAA